MQGQQLRVSRRSFSFRRKLFRLSTIDCDSRCISVLRRACVQAVFARAQRLFLNPLGRRRGRTQPRCLMIRRLHQQGHRQLYAPSKAPRASTTLWFAAKASAASHASFATHSHCQRAPAQRVAASGTNTVSHAVSERTKLANEIRAVSSVAMLVQMAECLRHQSTFSAEISGSITVQLLQLLSKDWPLPDTDSPDAANKDDGAAAAEQAQLEAAAAASEAALAAAQQAAAAIAAYVAAAKEAAQLVRKLVGSEAASSAGSALRDATSDATDAAAALAATSKVVVSTADKVAQVAAALNSAQAMQQAAQQATGRKPGATRTSTSAEDLLAAEALLQQCLANLLAGSWSEPSDPRSTQNNGDNFSIGSSGSGSRDTYITAALLALAEIQSRLPGATNHLKLAPATDAALTQEGTAAQRWAALLEGVVQGRQERRLMARELLQTVQFVFAQAAEDGDAGQGDDGAEWPGEWLAEGAPSAASGQQVSRQLSSPPFKSTTKPTSAEPAPQALDKHVQGGSTQQVVQADQRAITPRSWPKGNQILQEQQLHQDQSNQQEGQQIPQDQQNSQDQQIEQDQHQDQLNQQDGQRTLQQLEQKQEPAQPTGKHIERQQGKQQQERKQEPGQPAGSQVQQEQGKQQQERQMQPQDPLQPLKQLTALVTGAQGRLRGMFQSQPQEAAGAQVQQVQQAPVDKADSTGLAGALARMMISAVTMGGAAASTSSQVSILDLCATGVGDVMHSNTDPGTEASLESIIRGMYNSQHQLPGDARSAVEIRGTREFSLELEKAHILNKNNDPNFNRASELAKQYHSTHTEEQWQQLLDRACPQCPSWLRRPTEDREDLYAQAAATPTLSAAVLLAQRVHAQQYEHDLHLYNQLLEWTEERHIMSQHVADIEALVEDFPSMLPDRQTEGRQLLQEGRDRVSTAVAEVTRLRNRIGFEDFVLRWPLMIPGRSSYVLNAALQRHLQRDTTTSSNDSSSTTSGSGNIKYILEQLPHWILKLRFWPSPATCRLLASCIGSRHLLAAVPSGQISTADRTAVLDFLSSMVATALSDPEGCCMSPDDVSRWLRRVMGSVEGAAVYALEEADQQAAGDNRKGIRVDPFTDHLGILVGLRPTKMLDETDRRIAALLSTVDQSSGDVAAVVEVCLHRVQRRFVIGDQQQGDSRLRLVKQGTQLLEQTVAALQRVRPSEQPALLRCCLEVAGTLLPEAPEAFLQVLRQVTDDVASNAASGAKSATSLAPKAIVAGQKPPAAPLEGLIFKTVLQQIALHRQPAEQAAWLTRNGRVRSDSDSVTASTPLQVAASLLQLSLTHAGILLRSTDHYEAVLRTAVQDGQDSLALQLLTTLFSAGDRVLPPKGTLSPDLLSCIVRQTPAVTADTARLSLSSLMKAATPLDNQRRTLLLQGLLEASAAERSSNWAHAVALEAPPGCFTPALASNLITAFIEPALSSSAGGLTGKHTSERGVDAAVRAVHVLKSGGSLSAMSPTARQTFASWLFQRRTGAKSTADNDAGSAPSSLPLTLALDLWPTADVARQLLEHHAPALTVQDLQHVITLAAQMQWAGFVGSILRCLDTLPHMKPGVLRDGKAVTLARLLVDDAAGGEGQRRDGQPGSLSLLLGFLEESVVGAAEGRGKAVPQGATRVALSRSQWRELLSSLLNVSDSTGSQEAAEAAAALVDMVQAATLVGPTPDGARTERQQSTSDDDVSPFARMSWVVQECLLVRGSLRQPASLSLAQRLLWDLRSQGWGMGSGEGHASQQSAALGVDLLLWMAGSPAIRGSVGSAADVGKSEAAVGPQNLFWLPELVSDLCVHLAASGAGWVTKLSGNAQSVTFVGQACADHGAPAPLVNLMAAAMANKSVSSKVTSELVGKAMDTAADLRMWREGSALLEHLGLDLKSWRSQQGLARCHEAMTLLSPAQVQAALTILVQDAPSYAIEGPSNNARALAAVCCYCEKQLNSAKGGERRALLHLLLSGRQAAAAAASEFSVEQSGRSDSPVAQELDPDWHCQQAELVVRQEAVSVAIAVAGVDSVAGASTLPSADVDVLLQLMGVFEAAQRPVYAVRLGLEVASGLMEVAPSPTSCCDLSVVASAMSISTQCGYCEGAVVLLEELLVARGEVSDTHIMAQAVEAVAGAIDGDELSQRIVAAVGEEGYFAMDDICSALSSSGSDSSGEGMETGGTGSVVVKADSAWLGKQQTLSVQQRQLKWALLLQRWVAGTQTTPESTTPATQLQPSWSPETSVSTAPDTIKVTPQEQESSVDPGLRYIVALCGGKEFKAGDRRLLRERYPHDELQWFGDSQSVGQGNRSEEGLIRKVKSGRVRLVLILALSTHPVASSKVKDACRTHGIKCLVIPGNLKASVNILV